MPFYDLKCTSCDSEHNISASMNDKSEKKITCPDCGSSELETVFKAPPAVLKGMPDMGCMHGGSCGGGGGCPHAG